ncbi:hypothetical protein ACH5RR_006193 [Cinchona calisaya]|uniref:Protein BIG GRAIN 1-like A n=1 Tax=Cinchona calisaya TaxID=153742 RepID=A0ABD3ANB8_9GENT
MTTWERPIRENRKTPSFSSSLLDAIYHSIDESSHGKEEPRKQEQQNNPVGIHHTRRRNNAPEVEEEDQEEIASLRRVIMVEKWVENYKTSSRSCSNSKSRHINSDSSSSTDSSFFSSSETESAASKSTPKTSSTAFHVLPHPPPYKASAGHQTVLVSGQATPKHEGRLFMRTKSRALKIYGDLKKVKQPISPGGKIANFLNSIFSSRNLKKHEGMEDWSSVRKSRSVKDSSTTTCSLTSSTSCLMNKPPRSSRIGNKSERSVRFCPVSVILDEDSQPCGHKSIIYDDDDPSLTPMPKINSHFLKKNIDSFRNYEEKKSKKYDFMRGYDYQGKSDDDIDDGYSCSSSDLFELENIGIVGIGHGIHREELPVYGTTNLKINQAIASGLVM